MAPSLLCNRYVISHSCRYCQHCKAPVSLSVHRSPDVGHEMGLGLSLPTRIRVFETKVTINSAGILPILSGHVNVGTVSGPKPVVLMLASCAIHVSPTNAFVKSVSNHIPLSNVFFSAVTVNSPVTTGFIGPFSETQAPPRVDDNAPHLDPVEGVTRSTAQRGKGEPSGPVIVGALVDHKGNVSLTVRVSAFTMLIPSHHIESSRAGFALARWASNPSWCRFAWVVLSASAWVSSSPSLAIFTKADGQLTRVECPFL